MKNKYDVIIIGAGIGGLVCGCYLAQAGFKVLLVEKNKKVGGCASSVMFDGFTFDMGAHLIGGYNTHGLLRYYLRKLQLEIEFVKLNPFDRLIFGKETIDIPDVLDTYISNLQRMFPAEKENITSFFSELIKIYRSYFLKKHYIRKYSSSTYQEFLDCFIKNEKLKGILSGQCPYVGLPPKNASVIAVSFMMVSYLRDGMYYTKGGTQVLADSLSKKIIESSGYILCSSNVEKIKIEKNVAKGIFINKNDFIESEVVISNIDAEKTFFKMIGCDSLKEKIVKKLEKMKKGNSLLQLHLAVDIKKKSLKEIIGWYYKNCDVNNCFNDAFYIFVPTLVDNTLAPKGKNIIQILQIFSGDPSRDINWQDAKEKEDVENSLLERVETATRLDLKKSIINKIMTTPRDIERFTGNSCGSAYGWEMSPQQILDHRLSNVTPVKNLFLVGHWTNPGCGILGVATSGMETGNKIAKRMHEQKV